MRTTPAGVWPQGRGRGMRRAARAYLAHQFQATSSMRAATARRDGWRIPGRYPRRVRSMVAASRHPMASPSTRAVATSSL